MGVLSVKFSMQHSGFASYFHIIPTATQPVTHFFLITQLCNFTQHLAFFFLFFVFWLNISSSRPPKSSKILKICYLPQEFELLNAEDQDV